MLRLPHQIVQEDEEEVGEIMDGGMVKEGEGREAIDPNPQQECLKGTHPK